MSDPRFVRAGDARFLVGQLRDQLRALVEEVGPYADPPAPTMALPRRPDGATGQVWQVPGPPSLRPLAVIALDQEAGVFIQGAEFSLEGDWHALGVDHARSFALALLAAADRSERTHLRGGPAEVDPADESPDEQRRRPGGAAWRGPRGDWRR